MGLRSLVRALREEYAGPTTRYTLKCNRCKAFATVDFPRTNVIADLVTATKDIHGKLALAGFKNVRPLDPKDVFPLLNQHSLYCCNTDIAVKPLKATYNKDVPCNAKCTAAKGNSCECACAGKNHGKSFSL